MSLRFGMLLAGIALLSGCASWSTFNKDRTFWEGGDHVTFMDAKQRVLISNVKITENPTTHFKETIRRFCAEPSPDALSAIAASMGVNLSVPTKGELGYSQAFTEGASSIGLRTQTIQSLRDITYRDCEAFINGGITGFGLETLQRRFQSTLVAVLAIEQLTGVIKAPAVALSGQAKGIDADALAAAIKLVDAAETAAKTTQAAQETAVTTATDAQTAFDKFKSDNPAVKDDPKATDDPSKAYQNLKNAAVDTSAKAVLAKAENAKRQADLTDAKALRMAATSAGRSGSINAIIESDPAQKSLDAASVKSVSDAVVTIVENTINLGFGREFCPTLFGQIATGNIENLKVEPGLTLANQCVGYLKESVNLLITQNAIANKTSEDIGRVIAMQEKDNLTPEQAVNLINALTAHSQNTQAPVFSTPAAIPQVQFPMTVNPLNNRANPK